MSELQPAPRTAVRPSASRAVGRAADRAADRASDRAGPTGITDVWQRHGQAMFALALVVCEDADVAEDVVVQAILDACTPADIAVGSVGRQELARYVYVLHQRRRALGLVGTSPDLSPSADALGSSGVAAAADLSHRQRSAIALALFGDHTYGDIATLMGESPPAVAELMRSGLIEAGHRRS